MATVRTLLAVVLFTACSAASAMALDATDVYNMLANGVSEDVVVNVVSTQGLSRPITSQDIYCLNSVGASSGLISYLSSAPGSQVATTYAPAPVVVNPAPVVVASPPVVYSTPVVYAAPAPVYYAPAPRSSFSLGLFFGGGKGWGGHGGGHGGRGGHGGGHGGGHRR